jgi:hypothetical protein
MPVKNSQHKRPANQPDEPSAVNPKGEAEFLKRQADQAAIAMNRAITEAKARLGQGLSLPTIARDYPLATVAAGLVAGFVTASAITPSKRDSALKRLAEIERALHPEGTGPASVNGHAKPAGPSFATTALKEVFSLVRPMLASGLSAMVAAHHAADKAADDAVEKSTGIDPNDPTTGAAG